MQIYIYLQVDAEKLPAWPKENKEKMFGDILGSGQDKNFSLLPYTYKYTQYTSQSTNINMKIETTHFTSIMTSIQQ